MSGRSGHRRDITPGQARLVTARFVLRQLLFFSVWRKSLISEGGVFRLLVSLLSLQRVIRLKAHNLSYHSLKVSSSLPLRSKWHEAGHQARGATENEP